jgi:hypothetical protein
MSEKNTDRILDLILSKIEKLNDNQEKLSEEIQKTNLELTKISGLKHAISSVSEWKESVEKVVNVSDLEKMKEFYMKHQDIDADVTDLYQLTKELTAVTEDYKKFKVKTMTIIGVISVLFTVATTIISWLVH